MSYYHIVQLLVSYYMLVPKNIMCSTIMVYDMLCDRQKITIEPTTAILIEEFLLLNSDKTDLRPGKQKSCSPLDEVKMDIEE